MVLTADQQARIDEMREAAIIRRDLKEQRRKESLDTYFEVDGPYQMQEDTFEEGPTDMQDDEPPDEYLEYLLAQPMAVDSNAAN